MGRIIPLHGEHHDSVQRLLPWYVTGKLDASDRAEVEAHLSECAECHAEVMAERRLSALIADLPIDAEQGWAELRKRVELAPRGRRRAAQEWWGDRLHEVSGVWRAGPLWLRLAFAAQLCLLLAAGFYLTPTAQMNRYHALGAAPVSTTGNAVVIFRSDVSVKDLSRMLEANDARLVDGPTAAGAYVLRVRQTERAAVLARLRQRPQIELAEPIDAAQAP
jgi:anti-sigma-K factor RskA